MKAVRFPEFGGPVDVVLNLATLSEADMSALVGLVEPGGLRGKTLLIPGS